MQYNRGWDEAAAVRARLLSDMLSAPTRVIVFPNKILNGEATYALSELERHTVAGGNFNPIANQYLKTLKRLGIEYFNLVGFSQGAAIGAATLRAASGDFEVKSSGLIDPPNVVERTRNELEHDFMSTGIDGLKKAINDAKINADDRAGRVAKWERVALLGHLAAFKLNSMTKQNKAIEDGFRVPNFLNDTKQALRDNDMLNVLLASGRQSKVAPPEVMEQVVADLYEFRDRFEYIGASGYGHEVGSNIMVFALIGRAAIEGLPA